MYKRVRIGNLKFWYLEQTIGWNAVEDVFESKYQICMYTLRQVVEFLNSLHVNTSFYIHVQDLQIPNENLYLQVLWIQTNIPRNQLVKCFCMQVQNLLKQVIACPFLCCVLANGHYQELARMPFYCKDLLARSGSYLTPRRQVPIQAPVSESVS